MLTNLLSCSGMCAHGCAYSGQRTTVMSFHFLGTIFPVNTQIGSLTGLNQPSRQDWLLSEPQGSVSACPELGLQVSINHHTHAVSQAFGGLTSSPFTNISSTESSHQPLKFPLSNQNILRVVTAKTVKYYAGKICISLTKERNDTKLDQCILY